MRSTSFSAVAPASRRAGASRNESDQILIKTLSGFRYLCQQLALKVLGRIFLMASKIYESLRCYQEYPAKSVGKQGEEFLIAAQVKS
jgi:hypothetical protein